MGEIGTDTQQITSIQAAICMLNVLLCFIVLKLTCFNVSQSKSLRHFVTYFIIVTENTTNKFRRFSMFLLILTNIIIGKVSLFVLRFHP